MYTLLLILLILVCIGAWPVAPWWGPGGHALGWFPSGVSLLLVLLLVVLLVGMRF